MDGVYQSELGEGQRDCELDGGSVREIERERGCE